jgi:hypothetical protein
MGTIGTLEWNSRIFAKLMKEKNCLAPLKLRAKPQPNINTGTSLNLGIA